MQLVEQRQGLFFQRRPGPRLEARDARSGIAPAVAPDRAEQERALLLERSEINGHPAVRYIVENTEEVLYPVGTRSYGYLVEVGGEAFVDGVEFCGDRLALFGCHRLEDGPGAFDDGSAPAAAGFVAVLLGLVEAVEPGLGCHGGASFELADGGADGGGETVEARFRELGNTVSQIDLSRQVKDPPASMDQLLQGRAAGVTVMQSTGSAGAGAQIRLRGAVSVSQSNQPIIYIDGIRVRSDGYRRNRPAAGTDFEGRSTNIQSSPLNDLNPADIERIEIIKGAAASTLYGTEAAAGVIQIFTKKGSRGDPRWTLQVDQGFAKLMPFGTDWNPYLNFTPGDSVVLDANNQLQTAVEYPSAGYCPELVAAARREFERTGTFPAVQPCSFLRAGHRQRNAASVTGGFGSFQYFLSGTWEDFEGVLPDDNERKVVTRGNFSFDLSDKIRFDWNTAYSNANFRNTPSGNNAQGLTLNVYRAERNYRQSSNPVVMDSLLHQSLTTDIDRLITGGSVYYTPFPAFTNRFTLGLDLAGQETMTLQTETGATVGQFAGRLTIAVVLVLEQSVGGDELFDFGAGAPLGSEADQDRQREDSERHGDCRTRRCVGHWRRGSPCDCGFRTVACSGATSLLGAAAARAGRRPSHDGVGRHRPSRRSGLGPGCRRRLPARRWRRSARAVRERVG